MGIGRRAAARARMPAERANTREMHFALLRVVRTVEPVILAFGVGGGGERCWPVRKKRPAVHLCAQQPAAADD